jgi:hypothetical protein
MKTGTTTYAMKRKGADGPNPLDNPQPDPTNPLGAGGPDAPKPKPDAPKPDVPKAGGDMSGGIGVQLDRDDTGDFEIVAVDPQGPGAQSLHAGDSLESVGGQPVKGLQFEQLIRLLRGAPGTQVTVGVMGDDDKTRMVTLTRKRYDMPPMPGKDQPAPPVQPNPGPFGGNGGGGGGGAGAYTHKNGEFTITPPAGWKQQVMNDQNVQFTDPTGATSAEVIYIPKPGFQSSKEFYERGLKPDLTRKNVQIQVEKDFPIGNETGYGCFFINPQGQANYFCLLMKDGNGYIYHSSGTPEGIEQNNAAMNEMSKSFKVGR